MLNSNTIKSFGYFFLVLCSVLFSTCKRAKGNSGPILCADILVLPTISLNLIDKSTGNSLVFGSGAKLKINQLKFITLQNGTGDTLSGIFADSVNKVIYLPLYYRYGLDTSYLNIQGYPTDTFIVGLASGGQACPQPTIISINLDGKSYCSPCTGVLTLSK